MSMILAEGFNVSGNTLLVILIIVAIACGVVWLIRHL